jgi:uncharacterized membrane protein YraQ (UPF0718 family)
MFTALLNALCMAFAMGWEILWPLVLGFALSAVIQAIVSHREMSRLLPDDSPRSISIALALGAASSSCSYAAVAIARSIFRKGANFTAAMAFEMASTNLVLELSIILIVLMGWHFMAAEAIAAPIMVAILALLFRLFLRPQLLQAAKDQAEKGIAGRMEGHAEMDMPVPAEGSLWRRITSDRGLTAISQYFVMDWAAVWMDIVGGLVIAGAIAAWVPQDFWKAFFLSDHPVLSTLWGPTRQFDPQPFHLDNEAAKNTLLSGLAASGWHTAAVTMRLLDEGGLPFASGIVGAGGELNWPNPARPGDTLQVESEVSLVIQVRSRGCHCAKRDAQSEERDSSA